MAACQHKGGRCACSAPTSVPVKGYTRSAPKRRKRRGPRKPPAGLYWVAQSSKGAVCGHHHRTLSGAIKCAKRHERAERAKKAGMTHRAAKAYRIVRWEAEPRGGKR